MLRRGHVLFIACLACANVAMPRSASADDDPRRTEADALMKEGRALADKKKETGAFEKFKKAYAVYPTANILFAMATSEQALGKSVDAIRHYRQALKMPTLHPNNLQKGKGYVAELEAKLGRLAVTAPAGTTLTLDGARYEGATDEPIDVEPGSHTVEGTQGARHATATVTAMAGKEEAVTLTFPAEAAPAPPPVPPTVANTTTRSTMPASDHTLYYVAGGLGLGAVAGAVAAIVFHGQATSAVDEAKAANFGDCRSSSTDQCQRAKELKDDRDSADTLTTVSLIATGALAAGAGVMLGLAIRQGSKSTARITPNIGYGYVGAGFAFSY